MDMEPSSSFSLNFNTPMNSGLRFVFKAPLGLPIGYNSQDLFFLLSTIIDKIPRFSLLKLVLVYIYIFNSLKILRQNKK